MKKRGLHAPFCLAMHSAVKAHALKAPKSPCRMVWRAWLLFFQEQIKGPENAPIARFDGLGCYQTGSEMGDACGARGQR